MIPKERDEILAHDGIDCVGIEASVAQRSLEVAEVFRPSKAAYDRTPVHPRREACSELRAP
jgi:hypothetical protein